MYGKDDALVTSDWREPPAPDPESSLIGTLYEGYPAQAAYQVVSPGQLAVQGHRGDRRRPLRQPGRHRVRPGQPAITRCRGRSRCCRIPRWSARAVAATAIRPTTPTPAGRACSTRAPCAGWRRSSATSRTGSAADARLRPAGHDQRAPRVRRRARRRQPPGSRQPGRDARVRRRPHRVRQQPLLTRPGSPHPGWAGGGGALPSGGDAAGPGRGR